MRRSGGYWNQHPGLAGGVVADLLGALGDRETRSSLSHLAERLTALKASDALPQAIRRQRQRAHRPGWVMDAVVRVLADEGGPMHRRKVHAAVERLLGLPVSKDSVDWCLSNGARTKEQRFERVSPGCYRLFGSTHLSNHDITLPSGSSIVKPEPLRPSQGKS